MVYVYDVYNNNDDHDTELPVRAESPPTSLSLFLSLPVPRGAITNLLTWGNTCETWRKETEERRARRQRTRRIHSHDARFSLSFSRFTIIYTTVKH